MVSVQVLQVLPTINCFEALTVLLSLVSFTSRMKGCSVFYDDTSCMLPAAITLIMMSGGTGPFASYVLRQLGMGELDRVELVVEPAVCRSLALAAAPEFRCDATNAEGAGVLRGLTARSRIGTQVVVEPQRASAEGGKVAILPQLILRKSDIVLWVRR